MDDVGPPAHLRLSIAELLAAYESGALDPTMVCRAALARARRTDPYLRAYREITDDLATRQAHRATAQFMRSDGRRGALTGVPIAIKDAFHIEGHVTTVGSVWNRHDRRATDSGAVRRLREAGAVFIGKTNTPEFCQSNSTENLLDLDTANPWDPRRTPGGSSGGSAAAVAAHSCLGALGSDGGGSIRIPASFSGLIGLKPTVRRCPDEGGVAVFADLASAGPLAWRADDARRIFGVLANTDVQRSDTGRLRIAVCRRPERRPVDPGVLSNLDGVVSTLTQFGHETVDVDLPVEEWYQAFGPILIADEYAHRGHLLENPDLLTTYELATLRAGRSTTEAQLAAAHAARGKLRRRIGEMFDRVDVIVTPTTAVTAFPLGSRPQRIDGQPVSRLWGATPFTAVFNLTGNPAIALPSGLSGGLPTSIHLVGRPAADELLLDLAEDIEAALGLDLVNKVPDPATSGVPA